MIITWSGYEKKGLVDSKILISVVTISLHWLDNGAASTIDICAALIEDEEIKNFISKNEKFTALK